MAQQRLEFSYGNEHKDAIVSLGLILIRLIFKNFADNLLQILCLAFGEKLFGESGGVPPGGQSLKVSKVFDIKSFKYLRVTPELKSEHCCFFHFLLGKRRNMSKRNELEVT